MGLAASLAYRVVAGVIDSRKLASRDKSCFISGGFPKASHSPISLTGRRIRPVRAFVQRYGIIALTVVSNRKNRRRGTEHGSAQWGDVFETAKRYRDKKNPKQNLEFPQMYEHLNKLEQYIGRTITRLKPPHSFETFFYEYSPKRKNPALDGLRGLSWPGPEATLVHRAAEAPSHSRLYTKSAAKLHGGSLCRHRRR